MLEISRKILAIFLAAVMLFSTLSFAVQQHICMGEVTDVSFFNETVGCEMTVQKCEENDDSKTKFHKENCCDNTLELISGSDFEQQVVKSLEFNHAKVVLALVLSLRNFKNSNNNNYFKDSPPPFVLSQIYKLDEAYLI